MIEPPRDGSSSNSNSSSRSDPDSPRLRKQPGDLPPVIAALPYTAIAQALRRPRRRRRSYVVSLGHTPSFTAAVTVTLTPDL